LKKDWDAEMKVLEDRYRRERKFLVKHNRELKNDMRALKVSVLYIHVTAVLFMDYHRTI
jgi:hypothetical protein